MDPSVLGGRELEVKERNTRVELKQGNIGTCSYMNNTQYAFADEVNLNLQPALGCVCSALSDVLFVCVYISSRDSINLYR